MEKVFVLMDDYFMFLQEFMKVYAKYSYSYNEELLKEARKLSCLNNTKIDSIHNYLDNLTVEEKDNLIMKINEIILLLTKEKDILFTNLHRINSHGVNRFNSGMQDISDKISIIEHKIYCYERIIIGYLDEKKLKKEIN